MSCGLEQEIQEFTCSGFFLLWFKILSAMSGKFLYSSQEEHQLSSRLAFHQSWLIGGGHLPSEGGCLWSCIRSLCFYWGHDSPPWAAIHQAGRLAWKPSSWRTSVPLLFGSLWNTHGFAVDFTPPVKWCLPPCITGREAWTQASIWFSDILSPRWLCSELVCFTVVVVSGKAYYHASWPGF